MPRNDVLVREFRRRRARCGIGAFLSIGLFALPIVHEQWLPAPVLRQLAAIHPRLADYALGAPIFAAIVLFAVTLFRFPSCSVPFAQMAWPGGDGIPLSPDRCPECGAVLR